MKLTPALLLTAAAVSVAAQPRGRVDFARDVQPIFREHCYGCHGPAQQLAGLRLDRRADAMRGARQSAIGPGNAEASRLYQRILSPAYGTQMPPTGPLAEAQVDTIREWIDEGAEWPDSVSGEVPDPPVDPAAQRLVKAVRDGERASVDEILHTTPAAAKGRAPHGISPLMAAALSGDGALVRRLLAAGADPNAANTAGATALMWAVPDVDTMASLLAAGADPHVRSDDRRDALTIAAGTVGGAPAVRLLLDYGASPFPTRRDEVAAIREAVNVDDVETFTLLRDYGVDPAVVPNAVIRRQCWRCAALIDAGDRLALTPPEPIVSKAATLYDPARLAMPTPIGPTPASPASIRAAVERSLPLLQQVDVNFIKQTGCVSCHHNSVAALAVSTARASGYAVNESVAASQKRAVGAYLESWRERAAQNIFIAGAADTNSYLLFGIGVERYPADAGTDAQAIWLKRRQSRDGHWPVNSLRPPIEGSAITVTALSMRALQFYAPPPQRAEYAKAVERARDWLAAAEAEDNEERAFRLLGLVWAGAPPDDLKKAIRQLVAAQRPDGGWAQVDRTPSDAYATGQALYALLEAKALAPGDAIARKAVEFLLESQFEDGSWFVNTRAVPFQVYFDSGFPYGVNQWISTAATAWATAALARAQ